MDKNNLYNQTKIEANFKKKFKDKIELKLFNSVDSTNNQAKKFINELKEEHKFNDKKIFVFAADKQYAGRGRRGHNWFSNQPASLAVSFLFKTKDNLEQIPQITAAAGLAVKQTFKKFCLEGKLKWPNDILIKGKKISGILSELIFSESKESYLIIGCGINLNNNSFSPEIEKIATSYYLETRKKINKNLFLAELTKNMDYYIRAYFNGKRKMIIDKWKSELDLIGKKIDLIHKGKEYTVTIKDIFDSGELRVVFGNGQESKLQSLNTSLNYQSLIKYNSYF